MPNGKHSAHPSLNTAQRMALIRELVDMNLNATHRLARQNAWVDRHPWLPFVLGMLAMALTTGLMVAVLRLLAP